MTNSNKTNTPRFSKVDDDLWNDIVQRMKDRERMRMNPDKNVEGVIDQLRTREQQGMEKYGVNTERTDLTTIEWLQHLQEELMDASVYIEKLKNDLSPSKPDRPHYYGESEIQYHGKAKDYKQPEND
tara:strand:- start:65 stop:445 length:381 start_codon:yes stop_codon:yes gene_type:complete